MTKLSEWIDSKRKHMSCNTWGGVDVSGNAGVARLTTEDGDVEILMLTQNGILLWRARFTQTPVEIIDAVWTAAMSEAAKGPKCTCGGYDSAHGMTLRRRVR